MRVENLGERMSLMAFTHLLSEAAKQQGFVLVDVPAPVDETERPEGCDCPPGVCFAELGGDDGDDDDDDDFDVVFDPDFELDDETLDLIEITHKREAVAQLGRIIEGITVLAGVQADLVKSLVLED